MNVLQHIVEPEKLLMTWQPPNESTPNRTRRIIGEVTREPNGQAVFRYLKQSPDFPAAESAGFKGYPAFPLKEEEIRQGVIETLLRRLPPRKREDFADYLHRHLLPSPFGYSDFALLGYTGARLPSDGFALAPVFPQDATPCDLLLEVSGTRHVFGDKLDAIKAGDPVSFEECRENPVDQDALLVLHQGRSIGFVNRALRHTVQHWLKSQMVAARVERINGKAGRPVIYVSIRTT